MKRNYCNLQKAFSLTEIFIVMGILAVLLAILLPVIQQAREKSRMTTCANNLHQLYSAFAMYAADNDGRLPPYQNRIGSGVGCLAPICGRKHIYPLPVQGKELIASLSPYTKQNDLWFCPSDQHARTDWSEDLIDHRYTSYQANSLLGWQSLPESTGKTKTVFFGATLPPDNLKSLTLLSEDFGGRTNDGMIEPYCDSGSRGYSHNDGLQTLHCDGSVKWSPLVRCTNGKINDSK